METGNYYYLQQNHHHQQGCRLMRYRSAAPITLLENHVNGTTGVMGGGTGIDGYGDFRSSSGPEMEAFFMLPGNGPCDMQEYEEKSVKQECQIQSLPMQSDGSDVGLENSMGAGNGNGSDLVRQSSSPARFFSNQGLDNGLCNNHISFSSMPSSYSKPMPRIAQVEHRSLGGSHGGNGQFIPNLVTDSRNNASLSGLKRVREGDGGDLFCGLSKLQTQNMDGRDCSTGLTHQFSLPKAYEEMDVVDKFWQFQGSRPCTVRAKRGCATHPRSIAERMRRMRISERMRKLQGLFPNIGKQTNTADMLDMAVEYIQDLQRQVETLRDTKAKCSC